MLYSLDDTIAAIATAPGGAMRGIVRLSGPDVPAVLQCVFQPRGGTSLGDAALPQAYSGSLSLGEPVGAVPCDVCLWPTVGSYTRQPVAELHLIGSPPLLEAALVAVCAAGARPAEPGEFTMRAFLAGRLDLTQAEAVLGVIDATGRRELDAALGQLAGGIARPLGQVRDSLLVLLAHLEAGLDFVEDDIEFISPEQLDRQLRHAYDRVARIAEQMTARGRSGPEARIVLIGKPNVGKSSLLNALAGEAVALVSETPGTTRDYVTRRVEIDGLGCLLVDTAGMARAPEAGVDVGVDAAAQQIARGQREQAQLLLLCLEATRPLDDWERKELASAADVKRLLVLTKTDLPRGTDLDRPAVATSAKTGAGLDALRRRIVEAVTASASPERPVVEGTAVRCRESLRLAADCLRRAGETADTGAGEELIAAEVRTALDELGRVVGAVYTDDVLDRIFSRFCIGK